MLSDRIQKSIVLITDGEPKSKRFGTGFVIRCVSGYAYVLTCAHVIKSLGNPENIEVEGRKSVILASGEEDGLDLAILKVRGLLDKPQLALNSSGKADEGFLTAGFRFYSNCHLIRSLEGVLGESVGLYSPTLGERIQAWDLKIVDENALQPGYSGSPVINKTTGEVLGIVSYRQGEGKKGLAISIEAVQNIWKFIDSEQLYKTLQKLGYSKQIRLFKKLIKDNSVAALLIYGSPDYGQRWLLNLLLTRHLPYLSESRPIKVGLNRIGRRFDGKAMWRELCRPLEIPRDSSMEDIATGVYKWWRTQNVILIFHQINWMPKNSIKELIQGFWLPLIEKIKSTPEYEDNPHKLLMFLVDYEGSVGSLETFFSGQIDFDSQKYKPIKAPKINEFSEEELLNWLEKEGDELPDQLVEEIDETVEGIMDASDRGIPELTLEEICSLCGFNWYEESEKWLIY